MTNHNTVVELSPFGFRDSRENRNVGGLSFAVVSDGTMNDGKDFDDMEWLVGVHTVPASATLQKKHSRETLNLMVGQV